MQNTSTTWKRLWAGGGARLEAVAVIGGTEYTAISAPEIHRALTQDGLTIGNAVSATCSLHIRTDDAVPRGARVDIRMRLNDGGTASEWLPAGTFFISRRRRDPVSGLLSLECYDALLKANAAMPPEGDAWTTETPEDVVTENGEEIRFTRAAAARAMTDVAAELAGLLGLSMDPRTSLKTGAAYVIDAGEAGATINELLCRIASANGGNWIVTPENRLRLVPVVSSSGAADAETAVVVAGTLGGITTLGASTVTGIRYNPDDPVMIGDDSGLVIEANGVTAAMAGDLYDDLRGATYQPYELRGALIDPAAELGDYVRGGANGEVASVLYAVNAKYGPMFAADISAPEAEELSDEYPYVGQSQKALNLAKAYARQTAEQAVTALDGRLDQQGVFNRLTNNGQDQGIYLRDGRIYINATYIQSGMLTLGGQNNTSGQLVVRDASSATIGQWDEAGLVADKGTIGDFTLSGGALVYGTPQQGGTGARVSRSGFVYTDYNAYHGWTRYASVYANQVRFGEYGFGWSALAFNSANGGLLLYGEYNNMMRNYVEIHDTDGDRKFVVCAPFPSEFRNNVTIVDGGLTVSGTKSRRVATDQYAERLLYCYETPSPLFGDVGEGRIGEDGLCYVPLDPVFAQTIVAGQYQVFVQAYGAGECCVRERRAGWFVVAGTPGLAFGWEIKAKQRDYDQKRLDSAAPGFEPTEPGYGADAAKHVAAITAARRA